MPFDIIDEFDVPEVPWRVNEAKADSVVDGVNILARAAGPFFLVNGASRNKRFYSESLWEKALNRSEQVIKAGQMLGTIGHEQPLDEDALLKGLASHRVSKLWIEKLPDGRKVGMGEILVLNTSAGRNLNAYLRGGVTFPVSSRAAGEYTGRKIGDSEELDAETYQLQTFDFVRIPGVPNAVPKLVESHKPGEATMPQDLREALDELAQDKVRLQNDLDKLSQANQNLITESKMSEMKLSQSEAQMKELSEKLDRANTQIEEMKAAQSDDVRAVSEKLERAEEALRQIEKFGTLSQVTQVLEALETMVSQGSFSNLQDLSQKLETLAKFEELGDVETVEQALESASEALDVLAKFEELGDYETVLAALEASESIVSEMEAVKVENEARELAEKFELSFEDAQLMLTRMDADDAHSLLEMLAKKPGRSSKESVAERYAQTDVMDTDESYTDEEPSLVNESRASRLFGTMVAKNS